MYTIWIVATMANKKAKGKRSRSRRLLKRSGPKLTVNKLVREFETGQKVVITMDPSVHSTLPHRRYQGKVGTVTGKQGAVFTVDVNLGNLAKKLLLSAAHLTPVKMVALKA